MMSKDSGRTLRSPTMTMANSRTFLLLLWVLHLSAEAREASMGINYGRVSDDILQPKEAVALMRRLKFGMVKIFDANPDVLEALAGSGLEVAIMVPNQLIPDVASSQGSANSWVEANVVAHYPATDIKTVIVGNEILSDPNIKGTTWFNLVPAIERIHTALVKFKLADGIKVTTSLASDALSSSYPPLAGAFRSDIAIPIIQPLLKFLSRTDSVYFANIYPYFAWAGNTGDISLDYAFFGSSNVAVQDGSFGYTNLFDAMVDATIAAMKKLGYGSVKIAVSETGWPTKGDASQPGASVSNAALYNNRLVQKTLLSQGTPQRPNTFIPTYIFALFNENLKPGPTTERNWGVAYPNGEPVYKLDASGSSTGNEDDSTAGQTQWCVARTNADPQTLQGALDFACGSGADCAAIQPNQACYLPNTLAAHASYAFSSYWHNMKSLGGTCHFEGVAVVSLNDPSYAGCKYPSV